MRIPNEQQKRELAELNNSKVLEYLNDAVADHMSELIVVSDTAVLRTLQGRVQVIMELLELIKKSYEEMSRGTDSKENRKFLC